MKNQTAWPALLLLLLPLISAGQGGVSVHYDSLTYFLDIADTTNYYKCLSRQARIAAEKLKDKSQLDKLSTFLNSDPLSVSAQYHKPTRQVAAIFGSKYLRSFSDVNKAEEYYLIAHRFVADSILLDDYAWYVENELTNIYNRLDDYDKSDYFRSLVEPNLRKQISTSKEPLKAIEILSRFYVNQGLLRESEGMTDEAIVSYTRGLQMADSMKYEKGMQGNASGLARIFLDLDSLDRAAIYLAIAEDALDSLTHEKDYIERLADARMNDARYRLKKSIANHTVADVSLILNGCKEAIALVEKYFNQQHSREIAKYYVAYTEALLHFDSLRAASHALAKALDHLLPYDNVPEALPPMIDLYQENTFIQIFENYASYFKSKYAVTGNASDLEKAAESISLGIYVNDMIINKVAADPSKLAAIRTNKRLVHQQLEIVYQMYQLDKNEKHLILARSLFNRSKSLLLDEKIRQSEVVASLSDEERKRLREWQMKLKEAHELKLDGSYNQDSLSRIIYELQEKMDATYEASNQHAPPKSIPGNYIEYEVYQDEIFSIARIDGSSRFIKLDTTAGFDTLLSRLHVFLEARGLHEDGSIQQELYTLLITPVTDKLPDHLVIIPDAEISYIPFDMLKDERGRLIIEQSTISYAYQFETSGQESVSGQHAYEIYCLAPAYAGSNSAATMAERGTLCPLPNAKMEADSIQYLFGKKAFRSYAKTDSEVLDSLAQARIFHFSGHAIVKKHEAYLAMGSNDGQEYKLTADELSLLSNGPDLVVLSACETGLGTLETGEGIRSLGRSFAEAGAEATVFSLWNVYDYPTAKIMVSFYRYLLEGFPVDEALRKAKLLYLSMSDEDMRHPYFWAGFVAAGSISEK